MPDLPTESTSSNAGDLSVSTCSTCRPLEPDEIPVVGDEAWINNRWERVNIPSMWLAGGKRIEGYNFRRPIQSNVQAEPSR